MPAESYEIGRMSPQGGIVTLLEADRASPPPCELIGCKETTSRNQVARRNVG